MAKTRKMIRSALPLVDGIIEVTDARIPVSSRNPEIVSLTAGKPLMILLNKADAADEKATSLWIDHYRKNGIIAAAADCRSGKGLNRLVPLVRELLSDVIEKNRAKGMSGRMLRLMVVGIPNVGKSSFINRMAGRKKAKVEDRPGVTREKQWVTLDKDLELLDMPGVLWPKFEDKLVGERLAFTGAVKDDILDSEALACRLLEELSVNYLDALKTRFPKITDDAADGYELLEQAGRSRGMLVSGGGINTERAAAAVIDEFRSGKIGRITLELPDTAEGG